MRPGHVLVTSWSRPVHCTKKTGGAQKLGTTPERSMTCPAHETKFCSLVHAAGNVPHFHSSTCREDTIVVILNIRRSSNVTHMSKFGATWQRYNRHGYMVVSRTDVGNRGWSHKPRMRMHAEQYQVIRMKSVSFNCR